MILMFGLTLMLKTAACLEFNCSFRQSGSCAPALGDKLNLMMVDTSTNDLKIQKINYNTQEDPVCIIKNDSIKKDCDLFNNRHDEVSVNKGILIINTVIRADSGTYRLQVFDLQGTEIFKGDLQVIVEGVDPVVLPVVLGCLAVVLIILVIVAYYFYKKKNQLKPTANVSERVNEHVAQKKLLREEEQKKHDVEYATVNSQNKRKEEEVHYGEVTFTSSSAQRPRQTQDECVYSMVQTR